MILIIAEIHLPTNTEAYTLAKIWVNNNNDNEAETLALTKLTDDGCSGIRIIEATATEKDDYFAPCTSLDAFIRAQQEHIAIIYT